MCWSENEALWVKQNNLPWFMTVFQGSCGQWLVFINRMHQDGGFNLFVFFSRTWTLQRHHTPFRLTLGRTGSKSKPTKMFIRSQKHRLTRRGGAAAPPGLKIFKANSVFRVSVSCSEVLNDLKTFQYSEKFQGNSVFQCKRKLLKNPLMIKNMCSIQWIQGNSVFQGKRKLLKSPECKKYIQ